MANKTVSASFQSLIPLVLLLICMLPQGACTCTAEASLASRGVIPCLPQHAIAATAKPHASGVETVSAGTIGGSFSVTSTGEATYFMPLEAPPGRAGVEPRLALRYQSSGGDGLLGMGFSISGLSAITRCASNLAQDGEIREVRYDGDDQLCLDGKRLVAVERAPGVITYRTFPDSLIKIVGYYAPGKEDALFFEASLPSGLVIEYGKSPGTRPLARGGAARAWLATRAHDKRGNAMSYGYCFADAGDYTAEYALDEIRYTEPASSRSVRFVYGTKNPADIRTRYAGGMALQSSLRLEQIQMVGPDAELVRQYDFRYDLGPTTQRTRLKQVEECAGDGVCKPPTRFQYSSRDAGFDKHATNIPTPTSVRASPMVLDTNGDGLSDLVLPDVDGALSTPGQPVTQWSLARGLGAASWLGGMAPTFSQDWVFVEDPSAASDPAGIQPELGTALDYDQDGRTDILLHDVHGASANWLVLLSRPGDTFELHDTGIPRPFPLHTAPSPPTLMSAGASMHLADVNGDGVADLIQCDDHGTLDSSDPSKPAWSLHLWNHGFDPKATTLSPLDGYPCNTELYTLDINADGKIELIMPTMLSYGDGTKTPASTYSALTRLTDGSWEVFDTRLPLVARGGRIVFLDVNGDGLPDAVQSGFQDHALRTYFNTGPTFESVPIMSLGSIGLGDQDTYFRLAVPVDFNNDGKQDLLMPVPAGTLPEQSTTLPAWAVLQAKAGAQQDATFTLVDAGIPFEALLGDAITLADPHGPRVGDLDGDGAADVILPLGGLFQVFRNRAADQDLLIAVSDGMNAHDPEDPGHVPNVEISYGHLRDAWITRGEKPNDPEREKDLYLSQDDAQNECAYPRRCVVGPRRVVSAYALNNGADALRHFELRYRDGRYHRLGLGFLGFGERLITDLETGEITAEFFDNITYDDRLKAFPFARQLERQERLLPGLHLERSFLDITRTLVPGDKTYSTLPTEQRVRHEQDSVVLRDITTRVTDFDEFGHVLAEEMSAAGADLTFRIERTFKNDTKRWILGQLESQKVCSTAAGLSQCRLLARTNTIYGEPETEAISSDDKSPDTQLTIAYERDDFGNILEVTASDAYGHERSSRTTYDPEGIFPETYVNAAGHRTLLEFDAGLGVLTRWTDPNGLVTERRFDGFGSLGLETRPDGSQTSITLSRSKDDRWRVRARSVTTGGADDTVEYDSRGRPIRWLWHGPDMGNSPRLMQQLSYDARGEYIERRSVPASEGTPESALLFDEYEFDALGREVLHTTPWKALIQTSYDGFSAQVVDALGYATEYKHDALGRVVAVTDAAKGITSYTYGPFGELATVKDPGGALTRMLRDAFGRMRQLDDPDRGTTISTHDGFGELVSSTDAVGRETSFEYDLLGRTKTRIDKQGSQTLTTTWTWDTAAHGIGKLHTLISPDAQKTYSYTTRGQLESLLLAIDGESLQTTLGYDELGRVSTITYPTPAGAQPFVVAQDFDSFGHMLAVRDAASDLIYWRLSEVDEAGRFQKEIFGNDVVTERSYFTDKQLLKSIFTQHGATPIQNLSYAYDERLSLESRTDALQAQNPTERFRYDPLDRLTCAYFSPTKNVSAPCALSYGYASNGNLIAKSDVGALVYSDPSHPHAVTSAGSDSFGYNAVGNQITRPGATLSYTPFDLPRTIAQATGTISFGYDGDEQRVRKSTPTQETLYFGDLYERVTELVSGTTAHRYYVHSPERAVVIVTRGGPKPGTLYLHVEHLGSIDAITNAGGTVVEKRSYDPFGQRRNPVWGQPTPMSFTSATTLGFTGHESDDELGLINAKGRIYDPKVGRFLSVDPIVSAPLFGQSWNAYSYTFNNPLAYTDPSGFDPASQESPSDAEYFNDPKVQKILDASCMGLECVKPPVQGSREEQQVGGTRPPIDVSPTGNMASYEPQPVTEAPEDWSQNSYVQIEGGFLAGIALGFVPFGGVGHQVLDATHVLPHGSANARFGLAVGQIVGGLALVVGGATGELLGGAVSVSGIGALVGVPAMAVSATLITGGVGNIAAGIQGLMSTGSGGGGAPKATGGTGGGVKQPSKIDRAAFRAEREAFWKAEAKNNPEKYSPQDLAKMENGRAPTGPDGHPMELHHVDRTPEGGVRPMSRTDHRLGNNYKENHK